jgi:hypothetical protein
MDQSRKNKHIHPHQKLRHPAGVLMLSDKQKNAQRDSQADIGEIKQKKRISRDKPKCHGYHFKDCQHNNRQQIVFQSFSPS